LSNRPRCRLFRDRFGRITKQRGERHDREHPAQGPAAKAWGYGGFP
jgi:hypothetical protein